MNPYLHTFLEIIDDDLIKQFNKYLIHKESVQIFLCFHLLCPSSTWS